MIAKIVVNSNHYVNIYIEGRNEHHNDIWQEKASKILRCSEI